MFEKPQYLTPDGFKRLPQNPFRGGVQASRKKAAAGAQEEDQSNVKKKNGSPGTLSQFIIQQRKTKTTPPAQRQISDKAAELIARALKDMLRS